MHIYYEGKNAYGVILRGTHYSDKGELLLSYTHATSKQKSRILQGNMDI